jgi:hypothetical protein
MMELLTMLAIQSILLPALTVCRLAFDVAQEHQLVEPAASRLHMVCLDGRADEDRQLPVEREVANSKTCDALAYFRACRNPEHQQYRPGRSRYPKLETRRAKETKRCMLCARPFGSSAIDSDRPSSTMLPSTWRLW